MDQQNGPRNTGHRAEFEPLPARAGHRRRVGVEIEFGALAPEDAARIAARRLGGQARREGPGQWVLEGSALGTVEIYLDTALAPGKDAESDTALARFGVEIGRRLVPVEAVTEPVGADDLPLVSALVDDLEEAGAEGSRGSLLYGFGLHLNVELADPDTGSDLGPVAQAFAVLEPWLRTRDPLDLTRRILPFTEPFPEEFVTALCAADDWTPNALFSLIDRHIASRNHGLDLLPAYKALAPERFAAREGSAGGTVAARPAYHYRMPEARLGEPGWSLAYEWRRWLLVERVARDTARRRALCAQWGPGGPRSADYVAAVTGILGPLAALAPDRGTDAMPEPDSAS